MISLIACVCYHNNKLIIGKNGDLLVKLKEDMKFFKNITTNTTTNIKNVVLMGSKTYDSIPQKYRPLKDRINFVLTNDTSLHIRSPYSINMLEEGVYYMNMDIFKAIYLQYNPNVFVIGGGQIYNYFLHLCTFKTPSLSAFMSDTIGAFGKGNSNHALEKCEGVNIDTIGSFDKGNSNHALEKCEGVNENTQDYLIPQKLYITEVNGYSFTNENDSYTYMNDFRLQYRLNGFSQIYKEDNLSYRICFFTK
jgi:dihydrofolate reductase